MGNKNMERKCFPSAIFDGLEISKEKELYKQLIRLDNKNDGMFFMSASVLSESLHTLSQLLEKYYGQKVVMIIDELAISSETQGSTVPGMCSITARPFGQI